MQMPTQGESIAVITEVVKRLETKVDSVVESNQEAHEARLELAHKLERIEQRLDNIEPTVTMIKSTRSTLIGVMMVFGFLGSIAWAGFLLMKERIFAWIGWI
jgi:uncharacterized protein Yka (UPF0111/DUF47 family)